jgi:tetratricopeptide (TPR) repeat protein
MAVWAAEQYASRVAGREAAGRAAALLAGLGDDLQRAQVRTAGRQLLERARALDRDNRFAHLQLAAGFEKGGEYAPAVDALRRLVEIDPKSPEARVRLGVNLLRLGQRDEGGVVLDRLVREDNPEWVLAIAYQEMARELLRGDRPGEAADLLRGAVGRLPAQGRLAVQLAYALDRAGRSADAAAAVARMAPADGTSPRHRYNQWPEGDRPEMERRLAQDALLRLPRLAKALENSARWEIR